MSYVCEHLGSPNFDNNIKSHRNIMNNERYITTHHCYPSD